MTISTKFYTFHQNNSGGYYINNDRVRQYVIIEACNAEEANRLGKKYTIHDIDYCPCCGPRWSYNAEEPDGFYEPYIWEDDSNEMRTAQGVVDGESFDVRIWKPTCVVYHYDGRITYIERTVPWSSTSTDK